MSFIVMDLKELEYFISFISRNLWQNSYYAMLCSRQISSLIVDS